MSLADLLWIIKSPWIGKSLPLRFVDTLCICVIQMFDAKVGMQPILLFAQLFEQRSMAEPWKLQQHVGHEHAKLPVFGVVGCDCSQVVDVLLEVFGCVPGGMLQQTFEGMQAWYDAVAATRCQLSQASQKFSGLVAEQRGPVTIDPIQDEIVVVRVGVQQCLDQSATCSLRILKSKDMDGMYQQPILLIGVAQTP